MNLRVKESTDYFDIYSAQGHVLARIPKSIPDLTLTVAIFSHCMLYVHVVNKYAFDGHSDRLKHMAEALMQSTKDVDDKYIEAFNN
jgi:hypothetical protein